MSAPWDNRTLTISVLPFLDDKCKAVWWSYSNNDTCKSSVIDNNKWIKGTVLVHGVAGTKYNDNLD